MASICGSVVGDVLMLESCVTVEAPTFVDSVLMIGPSDVLKERPPAVDRRLVLSFNSVTVLLGSCLGIVLRCCSVLLKKLVLPPLVLLLMLLVMVVVVVDKVLDKDWRAASAASYFSVSTAITSV